MEMCDLEADDNLISPSTCMPMHWAQVEPKSEDGFWYIINKMIDILYTGIKGSINGQLYDMYTICKCTFTHFDWIVRWQQRNSSVVQREYCFNLWWLKPDTLTWN